MEEKFNLDTVSEDSVHGWLALKQEYHGKARKLSAWWSGSRAREEGTDTKCKLGGNTPMTQLVTPRKCITQLSLAALKPIKLTINCQNF